MNESVLRELMSLQERHSRAIRAANEDYITSLRQLIESMLNKDEAPNGPQP